MGISERVHGRSPPQLNAIYGYDPGLEIWRPIDGDRWLLEAKGTFYLPCANGRQLNLFVYFGTGGTGTTAAGWTRGGDIPTCSGESYVAATEVYQPGATAGDLAYDGAGETIIGPSLATIWLRLERDGGMLTWSRSFDGLAWDELFAKDHGTALDGLDQRVTIVGHSWFVPAASYVDWDYINVVPTVISVSLDIKPGSFPNSINPRSNGVIPVAILTTSTFDATSVAPSTLRFGASGTEAAAVHAALEDADGDSDLDMILHFRTQDTGILCGATSASLAGQTLDGQPIEGSDSIKTAGCK